MNELTLDQVIRGILLTDYPEQFVSDNITIELLDDKIIDDQSTVLYEWHGNVIDTDTSLTVCSNISWYSASISNIDNISILPEIDLEDAKLDTLFKMEGTKGYSIISDDLDLDDILDQIYDDIKYLREYKQYKTFISKPVNLEEGLYKDYYFYTVIINDPMVTTLINVYSSIEPIINDIEIEYN